MHHVIHLILPAEWLDALAWPGDGTQEQGFRPTLGPSALPHDAERGAHLPDAPVEGNANQAQSQGAKEERTYLYLSDEACRTVVV